MLFKKAVLKQQKSQAKILEKEKEVAAMELPKLKKEIEELHDIITKREDEIDTLSKDRVILRNLYEKGYIDADGNILK